MKESDQNRLFLFCILTLILLGLIDEIVEFSRKWLILCLVFLSLKDHDQFFGLSIRYHSFVCLDTMPTHPTSWSCQSHVSGKYDRKANFEEVPLEAVPPPTPPFALNTGPPLPPPPPEFSLA